MEPIKIKLLLIGPISPPSGGISVHIGRLASILHDYADADFLDCSKNIKKDILNIYQWRLVDTYRKLKAADLWHVHAGNRTIGKIFMMLAFLLRKKTVITLHGFGNSISRRWGFLTDFFWMQANPVIVVNPDIMKGKKYLQNKIKVEHAFIPPDFNNESEIPAVLIDKITRFKSMGKTILVANASQNNLNSSLDVYGTDIIIKLAGVIDKKKYSYHIILVISGVSNLKKESEQLILNQTIEKYKDALTVFCGIVSFPALIKKCDAVLRPTRTDGDALTVREALFLNKPVFASDAVSRPDGTIIFKSEDTLDLLSRINEYPWKMMEKEIQTFGENLTLDDYRIKYVKIYQNACAS